MREMNTYCYSFISYFRSKLEISQLVNLYICVTVMVWDEFAVAANQFWETLCVHLKSTTSDSFWTGALLIFEWVNIASRQESL